MKVVVKDSDKLRVRDVVWNEEHKLLQISFDRRDWSLDHTSSGWGEDGEHYGWCFSNHSHDGSVKDIAAEVTLYTDRFKGDKEPRSTWVQYELRCKDEYQILFHEFPWNDESLDDWLYEREKVDEKSSADAN